MSPLWKTLLISVVWFRSWPIFQNQRCHRRAMAHTWMLLFHIPNATSQETGIISLTCIIACNVYSFRCLTFSFLFCFFMGSCAHYSSGAKSNHSFPLICPDGVSDLRNNSQFRQKIPVQPGVIWFFCSPEIYMYSAYQLDYWQVGRITQFEVTCFSLCSIQCHVALGGGGERLVERMLNFLAPSFPHHAAHLFACF